MYECLSDYVPTDFSAISEGLDCVFAYLDGYRIASSSTNEHMFYLTQFFERLNGFSIVVIPENCVLGASQLVPEASNDAVGAALHETVDCTILPLSLFL